MPKVAQIQMIIWTFVAVFITGVAVAFTVLSPPSSIVLAKEKAQAEVALVETEGDRSPASVGPQFSSVSIDNKGQQALDFTLPCEGKTKFAPNVVQVRLTGSLCGASKRKGPKREIASTEIRNEANGFSATVFYPKTNTFTTDYMSLSAGVNRIRILHVFKQGGKEERDFVIERN